ncbi:Protein FAM20C precursor [Aphelenchoides avenae]|nr:Protein FAM20C precursor [Aphelenchus avenae]
MNTLRFYTKRIFALVCLVFFAFLILIASKGSSLEGVAQSRAEEWIRRSEKNVPRPAVVIPPRPGEQLAFQPQPPPQLGAGLVPYSELGIDRKIDRDLVDQIAKHIGNFDLKARNREECLKNITLEQYWQTTQGRTVPKRDTWERFYAEIGSCDMYRDEKIIQDLLDDLSTRPIKHVATMEGGTQVKLIFTFDNDKQAVFKPMRFGRDYETDPNHFYFGDFERHNAEIATFHLDKILGFRRAVPTVGRVVNMTKELRDKADRKLRKTFFVSPAKNHCFVSKCDYYCDTTHSICGTPDLKEGSVQVFLPDDTSVPRRHNKSPYRRTYSKKTQLAIWQQDMRYCTWKVKTKQQYGHGRRLLDLVDLHIMDYLIGNQDRHHYETFAVFTDIPSYAIHLDNGRAFGKTDFDDDDILMPLRQCCVIRPTTLDTLLNYYKGPKGLTQALHESLSKDPVAPVLAYKHYPALERRLYKIMKYVLECLDKKSGNVESVVLTEYHNRLVALPKPGQDPDEEADDRSKDEKADAKAAAAAAQNPPENAAAAPVAGA